MTRHSNQLFLFIFIISISLALPKSVLASPKSELNQDFSYLKQAPDLRDLEHSYLTVIESIRLSQVNRLSRDLSKERASLLLKTSPDGAQIALQGQADQIESLRFKKPLEISPLSAQSEAESLEFQESSGSADQPEQKEKLELAASSEPSESFRSDNEVQEKTNQTLKWIDWKDIYAEETLVKLVNLNSADHIERIISDLPSEVWKQGAIDSVLNGVESNYLKMISSFLKFKIRSFSASKETELNTTQKYEVHAAVLFLSMRGYEEFIERVVRKVVVTIFSQQAVIRFGNPNFPFKDPGKELAYEIGYRSMGLSYAPWVRMSILFPVEWTDLHVQLKNDLMPLAVAAAQNVVNATKLKYPEIGEAQLLQVAFKAAGNIVSLMCLKNTHLLGLNYDSIHSKFFGSNFFKVFGSYFLNGSVILRHFDTVEHWEKFKTEHFSTLLKDQDKSYAAKPWLDEVSRVFKKRAQFELNQSQSKGFVNFVRRFVPKAL